MLFSKEIALASFVLGCTVVLGAVGPAFGRPGTSLPPPGNIRLKLGILF